MKSKKALIGAVVIAGATLLATACGWFRKGSGEAVRVSGNIELTQVNISFKIPGRLVERAVDEGEPVKKGQVVARLDKEQLQAQRDRARAAVDASESMLVQQRTAVELQSETVEGQIQQRSSEVKAAEARLAELLAGSRSQEKEQARAALDRAQTEYDRAARDWKRAQTLFKNEDISAADHDQFRARFETAEAQLKSVKEQLGLVMEGPRAENIDQARAMLGQSRAALRLAEAQRLELRRRKEELVTREADIAGRRADLRMIETQLGDTDAVCPIDGVVLVKAAEPGEILAAGTTVITAGDLAHPWVRAYIGERDLGRVKLGAKAKVTTDSFPGKEYEGRVSFIASEAEFTPKQIQTPEERAKLVYRVKIEVDNPHGELKSNMPADAEILVAQ
jgi:HlyD family secretion protein